MKIALPKLEYVNMMKEYPNALCYGDWKPRFTRYWSGKLWYLSIHGHTLILDFRGGPIAVMRDLTGLSNETGEESPAK